MSNGTLVYLFVAYAAVWIVLFGYMFLVSREIGDVRAQLDRLRRQRQGAKPSGSAPRAEA